MKIFGKTGFLAALFALASLAFGSTGWGQALYPLFGPSSGIMVGDPSTPVTSSATSANVLSLWSGTCSGSTFLNGAGVCTTPAGTGVTSVAVPAPLTATTCSGGACVLSWTTGQTANRVLASPDGTTGAVTLRALVSGDIPPINMASTANGGVTGTLPVTNGGNGITTATLGDIRYGSGTNTLAILTGNTTSTNKFLTQTGTGTVSAAPAWSAIVAGDVPPINLGSTANGGVSSATILLGTNGGTSNGFFSVTGPATSLKTFTFPNASATVLTTNAAVTVAQGGTGAATLTGILKGNGTSAFTAAASSDVISLWSGTCSSTTFLRGDGACASAGGGAVGGSNTQIQYNNSGVFGGMSNVTFSNSTLTTTFGSTGATNPNIIWDSFGSAYNEAFFAPTQQQFIYTILGPPIVAGSPKNGPGIQARWDAGTSNRYLSLGTFDGLGAYAETLRLQNGTMFSGTFSASVATGTPTTIFTASGVAGGLYLASCNSPSGQAVSALFTVNNNASSLTANNFSTGGTTALSASGLNIQCTQTTGSSQVITGGVTRLNF